MKIDGYTKVILTGILVFLGFLVLDYKPTINAYAQGTNVRAITDTIVPSTLSARENHRVWQLRGRQVRECYSKVKHVFCTGWSSH